MNIVYAFIIIYLIWVRRMETEKHYCKYIIHRSIMYCLIYCESKLFILYMNIVYAFIIIDLICVRCMETETHYCKYIIHSLSIMYCLIYCECKLFILYINIVYAFIILDLICVRISDAWKQRSIIVNILYTGV